jgi:hypothetical protein
VQASCVAVDAEVAITELQTSSVRSAHVPGHVSFTRALSAGWDATGMLDMGLVLANGEHATDIYLRYDVFCYTSSGWDTLQSLYHVTSSTMNWTLSAGRLYVSGSQLNGLCQTAYPVVFTIEAFDLSPTMTELRVVL